MPEYDRESKQVCFIFLYFYPKNNGVVREVVHRVVHGRGGSAGAHEWEFVLQHNRAILGTKFRAQKHKVGTFIQSNGCSTTVIDLSLVCTQLIGHFQKYNNTVPFVCPPNFCINIVSIFSWDLLWSQEKIKTMLMQNFGVQTKSIMVFLKVAYNGGRMQFQLE